MKTNPLPGLIGLGCASALTRAGGGVEKMELIPLYFYADGPGHNRELNPIYTYVDPSVARIGGAAEQTRADQPSGNRELIPVERWTA
jgi:hypothetical protein